MVEEDIFDATRPSSDIDWRKADSAIALESPVSLTLVDLILSLARRVGLSTMEVELEVKEV